MSPVKEPRFFALDGYPLDFGGPYAHITRQVSINDLATYQALFDGVNGAHAVGEASPLYLYHERAPERIQHYVPDAKLIAILRDPLERAFSGYVMNVMQGRETLSFEDAIADEPRRIRENWIWGRYLDTGRYAEQLERYFDRFDRSQLRVFLHEDLKTDTAGLVREVFSFIGVDPDFEPATEVRHNVSGFPQNRLLHAVVGQGPHRSWLHPLKPLVPAWALRYKNRVRERNLVHQRLPSELRARLLPTVRADVLRLQTMIGRDLSHWLAPVPVRPAASRTETMRA